MSTRILGNKLHEACLEREFDLRHKIAVRWDIVFSAQQYLNTMHILLRHFACAIYQGAPSEVRMRNSSLCLVRLNDYRARAAAQGYHPFRSTNSTRLNVSITSITLKFKGDEVRARCSSFFS